MPVTDKKYNKKEDERKMEFKVFHNPNGAFRRKADYKNDMNLGEFASVYQQTLLSINELKVILK